MTDTHKTVQYQLRLSPELREKLRQSAEQQNRSMNADIVARIEQTFKDEPSNAILQEILREIQSLKSQK